MPAILPPITPRGLEITPEAARPIDAPAVARHLLRTTRTTSLATLDPSGHPYCTVTNLVVEPDGTPVIYAAGLALHARNLSADPRVSLTMADMASDVLTTPRLTLVGRAVQVVGPQVAALKAAYTARFAKSKLYLALPDSLMFRITVEATHLNGGPARNANGAALTPADLRTDLSGAADLMAGAVALIAELNRGDGPAQLAVAAGVTGAVRSGRWWVIAIDPDGVDLVGPVGLARVWLREPAQTVAAFMAALAAMHP